MEVVMNWEAIAEHDPFYLRTNCRPLGGDNITTQRLFYFSTDFRLFPQAFISTEMLAP
jgi:hypothetical protein